MRRFVALLLVLGAVLSSTGVAEFEAARGGFTVGRVRRLASTFNSSSAVQRPSLPKSAKVVDGDPESQDDSSTGDDYEKLPAKPSAGHAERCGA